MSHLAAETLPGYSSCCGTWLGSSEEVERHCSDAQFEKYAASEVAGLLDAINSLRPAGHESRCAGTFFITNLKSYVDRLSGGIVLAFAERVKTDYQMLNGWLAGNERPSLEGLLKLSFALGASAREVLLSPEISKIDLEQVAASVGGSCQVPKERRGVEAIRGILRDELNSKESRSLQTVASNFGYASTSTLYKADSDLCQRISERHYRRYRASESYVRPNERKHSNAEIETALQDALSEETPPRPIDIALRLGYSSDHAIRYRCPELIQAIICRRKEWENAHREGRRHVLQAAISEVPPPSIYELSIRHGRGFSKFLLNQEADLVKQLKQAIKLSEQKRSQEIRDALDLALTELPAPTLRALGNRLNCRPALLRKLYPEAVARITTRSRKYNSAQFRKKRNALEQEVLAIATELNEAGISPRYDCVIPLLKRDKDSLYKWDDISRAIQDARQTLVLQPGKTGPRPKQSNEPKADVRKKPQRSLEIVRSL